MRKVIATTFLTAMFASPMALAQNGQFQNSQFDPGFANSQTSCVDDRNPFVQGITSTAGQTIIGGLLGAALGNQFGGGSGKDIATGVGAAIGASAGAYNANRQQNARNNECQQSQSYSSNYGNQNYTSNYRAAR